MTSTAPRHRDRRVRMSDPLYAEVLEWLIEEAEFLDGHEFEAWLARLAPDLTYRMPVRTSTYKRDGDGISTGYFHFDEDFESMWVRVHRLTEASAWAEDPPSRTRRFVSNLRVATVGDNEIEALSYLLLKRSRGDAGTYETISCERRDRLHRVDAETLLLGSREILVDQSTLGVTNLSMFL